MSYYPTLREDVARAREILREGKAHAPGCPAIADDESDEVLADYQHCVCSGVAGGTIFGKDIYAAYKLLESFVEVIETMDVKVCELALRARKRGQELPREQPLLDLSGIPAGLPDEDGPTTRPDYLGILRGEGECVCRTEGCGHTARLHVGGICQACGCEGWR